MRPKLTSKCCVGYVRLSDRGAGADEVSLDRQRESIENWARENGLELKSIHEDVRVGGRKLSRKGLDRAIGEAALRGCVLVVFSLDRLSRNPEILRRLEMERVSFRALDCPDANELTIGILITLAEYYSKTVSNKLKAYHAHRKAKVEAGLATPHPVPAPPKPSPEVYEENLAKGRETRSKAARTRSAHAWRVIEPLVAQGLSIREIERRLNAEGYTAPRGGKWSAMAVSRVIKAHQPAASTV
jgi:DNA invertase Pin-like site-specific DNA recombinase